MLLLTTQQNRVLETLLEVGLNPAEFEWHEERSKRTKVSVRKTGYVRHGQTQTTLKGVLVHRLEHTSGFYFLFDIKNHKPYVDYSPSFSMRHNEGSVANWEEVPRFVRAWAKALSTELEAPDLWALFNEGEQSNLLNWSGRDEGFTKQEQVYVSEQLRLVQVRIEEILQLTEAQETRIRADIESLSVEVKRQSKAAWRHQLLGTVFSWWLDALIPRETLATVLGHVNGLLQTVYQGVKKLLE